MTDNAKKTGRKIIRWTSAAGSAAVIIYAGAEMVSKSKSSAGYIWPAVICITGISGLIYAVVAENPPLFISQRKKTAPEKETKPEEPQLNATGKRKVKPTWLPCQYPGQRGCIGKDGTVNW